MADRHYQLVVQKGPKPGQVYPLLSISVTIGRDPMTDIVISDPEVSRQHARLTRIESGYQVQDLGSTNGTFIDGERLGQDPVDLVPGQLVTMGSGVVLLYEAQEEADEEDLASLATMAELPAIRPVRLSEPEPEDFEADAFEEYDEKPRRHEPEVVSYRATEPPPARKSPPLSVPLASDDRGKRRRNAIIAAVILLILCCCCAFPLSGWFIWGDPLLEWLRALGFFA